MLSEFELVLGTILRFGFVRGFGAGPNMRWAADQGAGGLGRHLGVSIHHHEQKIDLKQKIPQYN